MPNIGFAIAARRKVLAKIHRSKEWKAASAAFKERHPFCEWHLACTVPIEIPTFVPHHPDRSIYSQLSTPEGRARYLDLEGVKGGTRCIAMCRNCHGAVDHSLVLCKCGRGYHHFTDMECSKCKDEKDPQRVIDREKAKVLKKISDANKRKIARERQKKKLEPLLTEKKKREKKLRKKLYDNNKARIRTKGKS